MPAIVTLTELKDYLGDAPASADDAVLTALLDNVEALYTRATLREPGHYQPAASGVTEYVDGTGSSRLYLTYPVATLTSVTLGYGSSEVLDLTSRSAVVYTVGSRVVTRTDGGWFGAVGQAGYVTVVYDHLGNLPADAKLPIMEVVASLYRNRGSEGMKSETVGEYSYTRDAQAVMSENMHWQLSVMANRAVVVA